MVTVRFFGLISVDYNIRQLLVKEGTVRQVLQEIEECCPTLTVQDLGQAIMFINKQHVSGNKRFSIVLKDGDELAFLSPVSGG